VLVTHSAHIEMTVSCWWFSRPHHWHHWLVECKCGAAWMHVKEN